MKSADEKRICSPLIREYGNHPEHKMYSLTNERKRVLQNRVAEGFASQELFTSEVSS